MLCVWDAPEVVTLGPAPPSGTNRIDLVVCQLLAGPDVDSAAAFTVSGVAGTAAASPVAPATPANAAALAQIRVHGGAAAIAPADITDVRPFGLALSGGAARAPLGASDPFTWFDDPSGERWVAKGGVAGGVWRRAKDALSCKVYRNAAFTAPTGGARFPYDTAVPSRDAYGMFDPTGRVLCPCPGNYHVRARWLLAFGAVGQFLNFNLTMGGDAQTFVKDYNSVSSGMAGWFGVEVSGYMRVTVGGATDAISTWGNASVAGLASIAGSEDRCNMYVQYVGRNPA